MKVSIIIPVIRQKNLDKLLITIQENAGVHPDDYEVIHDIDFKQIGCPAMVKRLTAYSTYENVMFIGDDCIPQPDFLKHAIEVMESLPNQWGVVGLHTVDKDGNHLNAKAHWMANKKILEYIPGGQFFPTDYKHCWGDNELYDIANELSRWVHAEKCIIHHDHPLFNKHAKYDEHYARAYSNDTKKHDYDTYCRRRIERYRDIHNVVLGICWPLTNDYVHGGFAKSFMMLEKKVHVKFITPQWPGNIDAIRNNLVRTALQEGCTHILMTDTDQIYHTVDMIERMLSHNKPIVGAMVHRRYAPYDPVLYRGDVNNYTIVPDDEILNNDLIEVDATGAACLLIDTRVFLDIPYPWFESRINPDNGKPVGEDIDFCIKAKAHDYKIYIDTTIEIGHLVQVQADWNHYRWFKHLNKIKLKEPDKKKSDT